MDLPNHLFRPLAASAGPKSDEAELTSPIAEPADDQGPRAAAGAASVKDAPVPPAPARQRGEMILHLGDILARVPTDALQSALHDPELELRFSVDDLLPGFSRGRAAIPLSLLAARYPEVFRAPGTPARETNVYLPMQKLMQQIGQNGVVTGRKEASATVAPAQVAAHAPEPAPGTLPAAAPAVEAPSAEGRAEAPVAEEPEAAPLVEEPAQSVPPPAPVFAPAVEAPPPVPPAASAPPVPTQPPVAPVATESGVRIQRGPPHIRPPSLSGPSGPSPVVAPPKAEAPPSPPVAIPPLSFGRPPVEPPAPVLPADAPGKAEPAAPTMPPISFAPPAKSPVAEAPAPTESHPDNSITVTPAPIPTDSAPATVPPIDHFLDQEPLQAIFMTDEAMDLQRVSELSARLPGITGCMVLAGKSFTQGGERPAGLDAGTLRELSGKLAATLENFQEALPAEPTITLYGGNRALSIFARGEISLCVVHAPRGFLPGVRERLGAVADILARCLPEADEEPEEASPEA